MMPQAAPTTAFSTHCAAVARATPSSELPHAEERALSTATSSAAEELTPLFGGRSDEIKTSMPAAESRQRPDFSMYTDPSTYIAQHAFAGSEQRLRTAAMSFTLERLNSTKVAQPRQPAPGLRTRITSSV